MTRRKVNLFESKEGGGVEVTCRTYGRSWAIVVALGNLTESPVVEGVSREVVLRPNAALGTLL